ncbi:MAG TPA: exosortase/archaeosortase family protein [Terriglobales bacterium]
MTVGSNSRPDKLLLRAHLCAICLSLLVLCVTAHALRKWLWFSNGSLETSDLWVVPAISLFLLLTRKKSIFVVSELRQVFWALPIAMAGVLIAVRSDLSPTSTPAMATLGIVVALFGAFLTSYGPRIFWRARFPLLFTIFAIPIPTTLLKVLVNWLQHGSAAVVQALFWLLRIDFVRSGLRFDFPAFAIEIASECSGIRSSFALVVLTVLIAEMVLRSNWRRAVLVAAVLPLVIVKNGIRIVTLTVLAMKVNPGFLSGQLHHRGGFVFFAVALGLEGILCWILARSERGTREESTALGHHATDELVAVPPTE